MKYTDLFEHISPELIEKCDQVVHPNVRFKDPFNDIRGIHLFKKMLHKALTDVKNPKFEIVDQACSDKHHYVKWIFTGQVKGLGDWKIDGMSALTYDEAGLLLEHIDYWDASEQFYEQIPVLGWPISCLKKRLQVS